VGALDTEQYEEPYATEKDYDVTLTFSDMAVMARRSWTMTGFKSLRDIIKACLAPTRLMDDGMMTSIVYAISTTDAYDTAGVTTWLDNWGVASDNWYDEDGEPMTLREVLEAVLQPLGIRLVQKNGLLIFYDLEYLYQNQTAQEISWASEDQVLGVDAVYNKINLTLSQYADDDLIDGSITEDDLKYDKYSTKVWYLGLWTASETTSGFSMKWGTPTAGLPDNLITKAAIFKMTSDYSSCDGAGVCCAFRSNNHSGGDTNSLYQEVLYSTEMKNGYTFLNNGGTYDYLFKVNGGYILGELAGKKGFKLRIQLDLLLDAHYNPFEDDDDNQRDKDVDDLKELLEFVYVRCKLTLRNSSGTAIMHYNNAGAFDNPKLMGGSGGRNGSWISGEAAWDEMFLAYYDWDNRKENSAVCNGWVTNRQITGYENYSTIRKSIQSRGDGEFIIPPSRDGWLELQIAPGVSWKHKKDSNKIPGYMSTSKYYQDVDDKLRWLLFRNPKISLVKPNGDDLDSAVNGDLEWCAYLDAAAEDSLDLNTTVGTTSSPTAKATLFDMQGTDKSPLFVRANFSNIPEKLLIATAYSQYATRHAILQGTADLIPGAMVVKDAAFNEGGTKFLLLSEVQSLRENTSDIKASELTAEEYESLEIVTDE
jgi:hypothetical protein